VALGINRIMASLGHLTPGDLMRMGTKHSIQCMPEWIRRMSLEDPTMMAPF